MKILVDVMCKECNTIDEIYADKADRKRLSEGEMLCVECCKPLIQALGTPQFNLKGQGYYKPGRS